MCFCTGFDIQMKGPDLQSQNRNGSQTRGSSDGFRTIQRRPGSARSADVFPLDPNLTYRFRVIPKARMTEGEPSEAQRIGPGVSNCSSVCSHRTADGTAVVKSSLALCPGDGSLGDGLSGSAIAGIAAGIPCSLLFLFLLGGSIYLCIYCKKKRLWSIRVFNTKYKSWLSVRWRLHVPLCSSLSCRAAAQISSVKSSREGCNHVMINVEGCICAASVLTASVLCHTGNNNPDGNDSS